MLREHPTDINLASVRQLPPVNPTLKKTIVRQPHANFIDSQVYWEDAKTFLPSVAKYQ